MRSLVRLGSICAFAVMIAMALQPAAAQTPMGSSANRSVRTGENSPFIGTWELDAAKTKIAERTVKFEAEGDDTIRFTNPLGGQYTFKLDGEDYPTDTPGQTIAWKQTGDNGFEVVTKEDGKVISTSKRELSPDGNTITIVTTGDDEGQPFTTKSSFKRESGAAGKQPMLGTWKSVPDPSTFPKTLTYSPAENGLNVTYAGGGPRDQYTIVFDGQDRPPAEKYRSDMTLAGKRIDDHTIQENWKAQGKVVSSSTIRVSPDGRELTETQVGMGPGSGKSVFVYRKQM